jgi:hypothetical protein
MGVHRNLNVGQLLEQDGVEMAGPAATTDGDFQQIHREAFLCDG